MYSIDRGSGDFASVSDPNSIPVVEITTTVFPNPSSDSYELSLKSKVRSDADFRGLLVFGEHPRELVASEIGLSLLQSLCQNQLEVPRGLRDPSKMTTEKEKVSPNITLLILPVANRWGRDAVVQKGNLCLRTGEDGVDINRDFPHDDSPHLPISAEARIIKDIVDWFKPHLYLDVHAGSEFIGYSPGSSLAKREFANKKSQLLNLNSFLGFLKKKGSLRSVRFKNLRKKLGYESPGNAVDYVFTSSNHPVLSFAIEVFEEPARDRIRGQQMVGPSPVQDDVLGVLAPMPELTPLKQQQCFYEFNPPDKVSLDNTIHKWTANLRQLIELSMQFITASADESKPLRI